MEEAVNAKIAELKAELERQHDETSQMVDEWLEETHQKVQDFTETNEEEDTSDILEDSLTLKSRGRSSRSRSSGNSNGNGNPVVFGCVFGGIVVILIAVLLYRRHKNA